MPKRHQSILLGNALPILLASSLVLSTHSLRAQKSPPPEELQGRMFDHAIQLVPVPEARVDLGAAPETVPEAPRSQTESHEKLFRTSYDHTLINTQPALNFRQPARTAELLGKAKYFTSGSSSQWLTSVYGKARYPTIQPADPLQYYGHYIPWAGPTILRAAQQAKAHPHVTNALKLLMPRF